MLLPLLPNNNYSITIHDVVVRVAKIKHSIDARIAKLILCNSSLQTRINTIANSILMIKGVDFKKKK
jgi:hypothetical protein